MIFILFLLYLHTNRHVIKIIKQPSMSTEIDTTNMPKGYVICYNDTCPKAQECLHWIAAQLPVKEGSVVNAVNLSRYKGHEDECPHFRPNRIVRMAYGFKHIYDNLPASKKVNVKQSVERAFGHTEYYRYYNCKKPLTPRDQQIIKERFARYGFTDPIVFDKYIDEVDW